MLTAIYMEEVDYDRLAREVRQHFAGYIRRHEEMYTSLAATRSLQGLPTVAFLGAGRVGKDTAAEILAARAGLRYEVGGTAWALSPFVAFCLKRGREEVFAARHSCREYWFRLAAAYTKDDPAALVRLQLANSDIAGGLRRRQEIAVAVKQGVITVPVWIEREGYIEGAHEVSEELVRGLNGRVLCNGREGLHYYEETVVALAKELGFTINHSPLHMRGEERG